MTTKPTSILDTLSCVRMTASLAEEILRTADPITPATLTERHLDVLRFAAIDLGGRVLLGDASDDLAEGRLDTQAIARVIAAFNARCGSKLTAETITTAQIRELRDEAQAAHDLVQVDLCNVALSGQDSDGTGTTLGTPCTAAYARQTCADAINAARARADG